MPQEHDPKTIWRMDRDHFIHPYTDFATFKEEGSQVIMDAKGTYVTDGDGRRILDAIGGLWCVNIGHGRKEMADAMAAQVVTMEFFNPFGHSTNAPASVLAAKLAELLPGQLNHVFYSTSGSTANDAAIRLVHFYFNQLGKPNKKKIISRIDSYHGATYVAASLTGIHGTKIGFDTLPEFIHHVSAANMYRRPDGMDEPQFCDFLVEEFEDEILKLGPDNVAAFIAEPVMGAGGVLIAPQGYHRRMYDVCKKYDVLYISDEVVTAFGRLGRMSASKDVFDVQPDIMVLAKGLTSGYIPLSATVFSDEFYDVISKPQVPGGQLSMGFTYSGHPVACAAALKNIEIIERENICEHVQTVGPYFMGKLATLSHLPLVGDVRGNHLMAGVELVSDKVNKSGFDATIGVATRVFKRCIEHGVVVRPVGNMLILSPPLIINQDQCDDIVAALDISIRETAEELHAEGIQIGD